MDKELLLYNYFANELTEEQKLLFEELLKSDKEFKEQFEFEQNLKKVIRDDQNQKLKSKLAGFEKEMVRELPVGKGENTMRSWLVAASIALLFGLGWMGYNASRTTDYDTLYASNFQEYPNTVFAITRGETVESIERNAFAAYETGDFQTAITNFNSIPESDRKEYFDFYMGVSQMSLNQLTAANTSFENAIKKGSEFTPEAHWYQALIAIKEKNKEAAIKNLKALTASYDFQKEKAIELLQELE